MGNSHNNLLFWNHLLNKNKFWWNSHWMVLFQKYVRRFGPLTKMAPTARYEMPDTNLEGDHPRIISAKYGWDWHSSFRGEDFFLRIFYELWTFAYFDRLCKLEKRVEEIKKKSSPLKLLSQSQPNVAEMILWWFFSNL
jgi:hypothetical protein